MKLWGDLGHSETGSGETVGRVLKKKKKKKKKKRPPALTLDSNWESPTISVLVGWSGSRLAPWLVPGVATLYKHMKCMVIMLHLCHCLASALVLV